MNLSMLVDLYELSMSASYFEFKKHTKAVFDLFIRRLPRNRSYYVAAGLEDVLSFLNNFGFDDAAIDYLRSKKLFKEDFLNYLRNLKFCGELWALPEATLFFPNEPILRVVAPIIEAQLIESYLLNTINLQTMIASKASRVVNAAGARGVFDFSLRRAQGSDAGIKVGRCSYLAGCEGTSNVLAGKIYNIPTVGTMAHSFVMSFDNELESFRAFAKTFPDNSLLLIDTYDYLKGIDNAVIVAKELERQGSRLKAVRLDSADIAQISRKVRNILDRENLSYVKIFASGNLDEYKIQKLLNAKAQVNSFGVGTNMGVSADAPYCDVIYKIAAVTDRNGEFLPTMKLSKGKVTYPGRKQIFRVFDKRGMYVKDVLGLEGEAIQGRALLIKVMENGRQIYNSPNLQEIREFCRENLLRLPEKYKKLINAPRYPVIISPELEKLTRKLARFLKKVSR